MTQSIRRHPLVSVVSVLALVAVAAATWVVSARITDEPDQLVVHEWGTFTALQDEQGRALAGINTDDEPVPAFVHGFGPQVLQPAHQIEPRFILSKRIVPAHPHVTMRLETPVLYFYPSAGQQSTEIDVEVGSRGGWLSEFFPKAEFTAPGLSSRQLAPNKMSTLKWKSLKLGTGKAGPETDDEVWLAPRRVQAANVTLPSGESEKFLFYRGVGRYNAPLAVSTDPKASTLSLRSQMSEVLDPGDEALIPHLWLVQIRAGGELAYQRVDPVTATADTEKVLTTLSSKFAETRFAHANYAALRSDMHAALVGDGLYADEADAMLDTWQHAYFQTPGLRLFFLVPRVWTDYRLPLRISQPAEIERVMMARIELVSPEQRATLRKLAQAEITPRKWVAKIPESEARRTFFTGKSEFGDLGVKIPADYQLYLDLGRFRNALVLDAEFRTPTESLQKFVAQYGLRPWIGGNPLWLKLK
jgi:hypothetical protein